MDELDLEEALTLTEAAQKMRGRRGKHPNVDTVRKWITRGTPSGLKLQAVKIGGEWLTCAAWALAFERARLKAGRPKPLPVRSNRAQKAGHRRAEKELQRRGYG